MCKVVKLTLQPAIHRVPQTKTNHGPEKAGVKDYVSRSTISPTPTAAASVHRLCLCQKGNHCFERP